MSTLEDGDCFGTPVVEASRLCGAAEGGHILVAEVVRVLARGRGGHEMTSTGDLELKGLSEPVPTFDVGWVRAEGVADLRARTPYVGRTREREVLAGRLAAARDAAGGLVLIAGEPGIGKTRLATPALGAPRCRRSGAARVRDSWRAFWDTSIRSMVDRCVGGLGLEVLHQERPR